MSRSPSETVQTDVDVAALVHALEVHQAELELQNQELVAANDELRHSNAKLARARDRYRALQELAPVPLITIDPAGVILDVNQAAEALLRAPRQRLFERRFGVFVAELARPAAARLVADLFAAGRAREIELVLAPDGEPPIEVVVDGAVLAEDGPARAVLVIVDVSGRRRAEEARRTLGSGTVLVVDDDLHVQRVIARIVKSLGFAVVTARGGVEALERCGADGAGIDLVLMDLTMPGMGGVEVAHAIRAIRADLPIVLVTGYGDLPVESGDVFAAMITKPFDVAAIREVIARVLPTRASRPRAAE